MAWPQSIKESVVRHGRQVYRHHLYIPINTWLGRTPLLIYTMGKVGSTAIYRALPDGTFFIQIHTLNPELLHRLIERDREKGGLTELVLHELQTRRHIIVPRREAKIITIVRDPIIRNLSAFYQNHVRFIGADRNLADVPLSELLAIFLNEYPHDVPIQFFEREFASILGIDVYQHPFDPLQGWARLQHPPYDVLILRADAPNEIKQEAICNFLGLANYQLVNTLPTRAYPHGEVYTLLKREAILPQPYIDQMLGARYTQHFFSDDERSQMRRQWEKRLQTAKD